MRIAHHSIDGSQASLPSTMAGLLEVAVKDARKLDRSIYLPYYNYWHDADSSHNHCLVCLAGSVIAGSLKIAPSNTVSLVSFDRRTEELLDAINYMRRGLWRIAFKLIYHRTPSLQVLDNLQALPHPLRSAVEVASARAAGLRAPSVPRVDERPVLSLWPGFRCPENALASIALASSCSSAKWRRRPFDPSLWPSFSTPSGCALTLPLAGSGLPLHTARMDRRFDEQLRVENQRWRRRTFVVLVGMVGFLAGLYSTSDPDDILTVAVAVVLFFAIVMLLPGRWFGRVRPQPATDQPRPALRSQPPPPPARERSLAWPPREGPLPSRPRRR